MLCTNNDYGGGTDCRHRGQRLLALLLLMRWSGLSIKDAVTLERNHLDDHGALFLRRAKTGVPVFVPLPPAVVSSLHALPSINPAYFFWSGNGDARSAVQGYERQFPQTLPNRRYKGSQRYSQTLSLPHVP
jgi:integrase/recombinase XerD